MAINPEMLKQLLEEFEEKQAVTAEEINEIERQIGELEQRIEESKVRLTEVAKDREKISMMKDRYASGDWLAVVETVNLERAAARVGKNGASTSKQKPAPRQSATRLDALVAQSAAQMTGDHPALGLPEVNSPPAEAAQSASQLQAIVPEPAPEPAPEVIEAPPEPVVMAPEAPVVSIEQPERDTDTQDLDAVPSEPSQALAQPPAEEENESLFPFSSSAPPQDVGADPGDPGWSAPPTMSWDNVSAANFPDEAAGEPGPGDSQETYGLTPDGQNPFLSGQQQVLSSQQVMLNQMQGGEYPADGAPIPPDMQPPVAPEPPAFQTTGTPDFGDFPAPPAQPQMAPPIDPTLDPALAAAQALDPNLLAQMGGPQIPQPQVPDNAEFDIAGALGSDEDDTSGQAQESEEGDVKNKKINDALRGLFKAP